MTRLDPRRAAHGSRTRLGRTWPLIALIVLIALVTVGVTLVAGSARARHHGAGASTDSLPPIAASDQAQMVKDGYHIVIQDPQIDLPVVSSTSAISAARAQFGFLFTAQSESVTLARLTDDQYGNNNEGTAPLQLLVKDRLVWLAVFGGFNQPYYGPSQPAGYPSLSSNTSRMWVAIDATTGKVVEAESL